MITPEQVAEAIVEIITGRQISCPKVINVNAKHLSLRGDLSFQLELGYWRGYVNYVETDWFRSLKNILQYFVHVHLKENDTSESDNQTLQRLKTCVMENLNLTYNLFTLDIMHNFVLINYERSIASCAAIKFAIEQGFHYGKNPNCKRKLKLTAELDAESEITNLRLNLLKKVSENLLKSQGYDVQDGACSDTYLYTIKSQSKADDGIKRCLCGAVLNFHKKKERLLTQDKYLQKKIEKVKELNAQKNCIFNSDNVETDIRTIAYASVTYELLSTKHTSPVIIEMSNELDRSIKEASFILYNNVRITAILDKYGKLVLKNQLTPIHPIEELESFNKIIDEESWSLIYNYIIKYPDVLKAAVTVKPKLDINIQLLWSFVSSLCHDFSKYYRKNRVLIEGVYSNEQILILLTERLHLLRALRIILRNSLSLLEVEEVTCM